MIFQRMSLALLHLLFLCLMTLPRAGHGNVASPIAGRAEWGDYGLEDIAMASEIHHSIETTKHWVHHEHDQEDDMHSRHERSTGPVGRRDPFTLVQKFGFSKETSKILAKAARVIENVTHIYGKEKLMNLGQRQISDLCVDAGITTTFEDCPASPKYRTSDGSCNNLLNVNWGKAFTPFARELPADYFDDISEPRLAVSGRQLPGARETTAKSIHFIHVFEDDYTTLGMNIGQFVDHDMDHSSTESVNCKHCLRTPRCLPIPIPSGDYFRNKCLPFARSTPVPSADCVPGARQQINQITSYLDLSQIYGSSMDETDGLRAHDRGTLHTSQSPLGNRAHPHLPLDEEHQACFALRREEKCGLSGDVRAAEQPALTGLHTVFFRQHNRYAIELSELNPHWSDETLYQETRRIMVGIWQHIVYNEYLPSLLGRQTLNEYKLRSHPTAFFQGYDVTLNPSVSNVFAAAAFRMGHSQIPPEMARFDVDYNRILPDIPYHEAYFNATYIYDMKNGGVDSILRGMLVAKLPKVDGYITTSVTRHLFADPTDGRGTDLGALNVQRGRDHGLPSYPNWRRLCGIPTGNGFEGLSPQLNSTKINKFKSIFEDAEDIDPFTAMIMEGILPGALVGETVACLLARQFHKLKYGDRFWYENGLGEQAFTSEQLQQIRKMSLSRMFCDNMDEMNTIQPYPFRQAKSGSPPSGSTRSFVEYSASNDFPDEQGRMIGFFNGRIPCEDVENMPRLDLSFWQEM